MQGGKDRLRQLLEKHETLSRFYKLCVSFSNVFSKNIVVARTVTERNDTDVKRYFFSTQLFIQLNIILLISSECSFQKKKIELQHMSLPKFMLNTEKE